jgi:hypothetical protein
MTEIRANLLTDFYDRLPAMIAARIGDPTPSTERTAFSPGFVMPQLDDGLRELFAPAIAGWRDVGDYAGHLITLLDLAGNPGTQTTKTYASLLIVARAVDYIRRTGESVVIFTPTSANKGVALRDAVLRALDLGLVEPEQLRVVVLAPVNGLPKIRASRLSIDDDLRALNPMLVYAGPDPEQVKALGRAFVAACAETLWDDRKLNLWFTLDLDNYLIADGARAFFEQAVAPIAGERRVHAHAVSSGFGMLGYHAGRALIEAEGTADRADRPETLLVQHLGTPDMVVSLRYGTTAPPGYRPAGERFERIGGDPRFPAITDDPAEVLDTTFYTHRPVTSGPMNEIIRRYGGDGIVVSRAECLDRYAMVSDWLRAGRGPLPIDPADIREWSTVMAFTGVLNSIDRGLIAPGRHVVVHGTGVYTRTDYEPIGAAITPVRTVADIDRAIVR